MSDAPAGIQAARSVGLAALDAARLLDEAGLRAVHADLVVTSLDDVSIGPLVEGRVRASA